MSLSSFSVPDFTFSVCCSKDIPTWTVSSKCLLEHVPSKWYSVIVPDDDLVIFQAITDKKINVIPESAFAGNLKSRLKERLPSHLIGRIGWYLQQFVKLGVLRQAISHENYLIWDSDTIALKEVNFFEISGRVQFYTSHETHEPYFSAIRRLLGLEKLAPFGFIAQCFPCKGLWALEFFDAIEEHTSKHYIDAIIDAIDFSESSGFSEYEALGTFIYSKFQNEVQIKSTRWLRNGTGLIGSPSNISVYPYRNLLDSFDHVTFERWEEPYSLMERQAPQFLNNFQRAEISYKPSFDQFLNQLFISKKVRRIVQVGANDGIQNDPLRKYIAKAGPVEVKLVEPLPHYAAHLRNLYSGRRDIEVVEAGLGSKSETRDFYFIPPAIADEMNGDGPMNNWAHGQGSFSKQTIIHWINENKFRGFTYVSRMQSFIDSISCIQLKILQTDSLMSVDRVGLLMIIDVQGAELEVLKGIDWKNPPQWIVVEDDLGQTFEILRFFQSRGYKWIAGSNDKVFGKC